MTLTELEARIARMLFAKHRDELTWAKITSIVGNATQAQKDALVGMFSNGRGRQAGEALQKAIDAKMRADAAAEAATMMADTSLSQTELERIFG